MQFYDETAKQVIGVLSAGVVTASVAWFNRHLNARDARKLANITNREKLTWCRIDLQLERKHCDDLHVVLKRICKRFHAGQIVNKYDIDAIEVELEQRPKGRDEA